MFWGITPALDLLEEYKKCTGKNVLPKELNILIVGGVDSRHVLKTMARKYRHQNVKLNFYLIEACMETVAKQLLLLFTALRPEESMGPDQKVKVFMELYGNTLIRPYTSKYLTNVANELVKMVTNHEYLNQNMHCINIGLKYKERDYLENILKFWCGKDEFNIVDIWDRRMRKNLGVRYDTKLGAFDWDLHMRMHLIGGKQICDQEYRNFRLNGIAYAWLESEVSRPNRSLVCAVVPNGENFAHYGYLGDMETGPFVAYGLECEDKAFLKSTNGQNAYRATDVIERNLKQIFHEIEHKEEYNHTKKNDMELGYAILKQENIVFDKRAPEITVRQLLSCMKVDNVSINFISISTLDQMQYKEKYDTFFDILYFASSYLKYFEKHAQERIAKDDSLLIIEHQLFVVSHREKNLEEYMKNVQEKITGMNLKKLTFDMGKDSYVRFVLKK